MDKIKLQKFLVKIYRYVLKRKFIPVYNGPLKDFLWSTETNYDFITGTYEDPVVVDHFTKWLNHHSVFYDLGANAGYYSLIASRHITDGTIYSFEPMEHHRRILQEHININSKRIKGNISVLHFAVSDRDKVVYFSNEKTEGASYRANKGIPVEAISVDSWVRQGHPPPDVMKIDVEGAELDVLSGARNTINKFHPKILLATHDCHVPGISKKCIEFLSSAGYGLKHTGQYNKHKTGLDDYIAEYLPSTATY